MVTYLSVEAARPLSGLRLAVTAHVPGIWSEAAKGLFDAKKIPYVLVEQVVGGENRALKEWTAQTSGPVAVWNDERPRSSWLELIYLAERLAPRPALIPPRLEDRVLMVWPSMRQAILQSPMSALGSCGCSLRLASQ